MANSFNSIMYWNTQDNFTYPEIDTTSPLCYTPITGRANSGICVSGGGSVSASLIAGYYQALTELGIMDNLRYISGVSGGTWGSAPFVYLPATDTNFSGTLNMPPNIKLLDIIGTSPGSMQNAAANADIVDKCLAYLKQAQDDKTPANRVYEKGVGALFLNPFGIPSPASTDTEDAAQFFSSTSTVVENIVGRNTGLNNSFMTMAENRPFLIMNTTMFIPLLSDSGDSIKDAYYICPFEVTPLYCGIKAPQTTGSGANIGGFFVETFGFNTTLTGASNNVAQATGDFPFELCQPVGASGSALEEMIENKYPSLLGCFPQFNYWNPFDESLSTTLYNFGDGGCIEDTGITPLLARGVDNIATFLTEPVFFPGTDSVTIDGFTERAFGYNQIACLFGAETIDAAASTKAGSIVYVAANLAKQVFDNSQFNTLLTELLLARTNGGPLIVKMQMTVIANNLFGITPANGYQPTVIWSVVDTCTTWTKALTDEVKLWMATMPAFDDFPEVAVFLQNTITVIELTAGQTNQLANFAYWMVMSQSALFTSVLPPVS